MNTKVPVAVHSLNVHTLDVQWLQWRMLVPAEVYHQFLGFTGIDLEVVQLAPVHTLKYFCFTVVMSLYLLILCANVLLIVVICVNRSLHEPMYMFLCSLFVNELYGSTGLFPSLLVQILSDVHTVSAPLCFLQIFCLYSYVCVEFCILAVMSYDRYLAICCPLQYHTRMTTVSVLIAVSWIYALLLVAVTVSLSSPLQLCGNIINKVYCDNYVVKLSCSDSTLNNIYAFMLIFSHLSQTALIMVSYVHLIRAAIRSQADRRKFMQTCLPHLITLLVFTTSLMFDTMYSRYSGGSTMKALQNALAAQFLVVPPLINPIIYGLNLQQIRSRMVHRFTHRTGTFRKN
uniref:Olfactory receptor n=1 Tax=Astatotilapia calliptera TaxID=8154 RepID=A0AAX7VKF0_ASTCA